jgi:hypothetical protein
MSEDPFSEQADPGPGAGAGIAALPKPDRSDRSLRFDRRAFGGLVVLGAAALGVSSGCAVHRLGCAPASPGSESCRHRFCRYHQGG